MTASSISIEKNVVYVEGSRPLSWDVYSPAESAGARPAVLLLHGGGLRVGDRSTMAAAAQAFAERGLVAIAPEYRLLEEAPWPQQLNDVLTAIRALRAQARSLAVNPDQIFAAGFSAGGFLALVAAGAPAGAFPAAERPYGEASERLAGVAAFFPAVKASSAFATLLGVDVSQIEKISPITYAASLPPTILFCGDADPIASAQDIMEMHGAIRRAGGEADLRIYSQLVHEFVSLPGMLALTVQDAVAFFERTSINKPAFDEALTGLNNWWAAILARSPG